VARLLSIFRFSWPYIRAYRGRLYGAVLAGIVFGVSNAGILMLTETILERLEPVDTETVLSDEGTVLDESPTGEDSEKSLVEVPKAEDKRSALYLIERVSPATGEWVRSVSEAVGASFDRILDVFFPRMGSPVTVLQVVGAVLGLPFLVAFRSGGQYLSAYWMSWVGERIVNDLRVEVLDRLSRLSLNYFNQAKMGDMITRINGDTLMLQHCISHGVKHSITDPVTIIAVFLFLLVSDWQLTMTLVVLLPICLLPVVIYGRKARKASKKKVSTNVTQSSLIVEMLSAIRVVKAYSLEDREVGRFRILSRQLFGHTMKGVRAHEIVGPIIETISMLAVGGLIVFVVQTERSVSDLMTFFIGIIMFYMPIKKLAKLHVLFEQTSVGVDRLKSVLSEIPEVQESTASLPVTEFNRGIRFDGVSFAYGDDPVLRGIDFEIPRGTKLGIAGESGSGKSTLINLLFRFFDPGSGRLQIDGVDLKDLKLKDYRGLLALVSQDVVVFDQSVYDNIACGRIGASREDVMRAAEQAHATEFIEALVDGFDTRLGERGVTLSGGQRQRIAIARAFVRNAPILVLDEATAALDAKSEAEVQSAIEELAANRTVICIAHRLSTLKSMDEVMVLDKGLIIEKGPYDSLLREGGAFAQMAARQGISSV
jgi:ATP-binding cassette, subfamily B, bacterial MsbA